MLRDKLILDELYQLLPENLSILQGKVINVHHPEIFEPITSVIQKFHNHMIYFRVTDAFKNSIKKGDSILIQMFYEKYEYTIHGIVSDFISSYPKMVELFILEVQQHKNKRKSKRFAVNFESQLSFPVSNEVHSVIVKSISSHGLSIIAKEQFDVGVNVYIGFSTLLSHDEYVKIKAKVIRATWYNEHIEYGLEILDSKDDDISRGCFDKLILLLNENEKALVRECLK